MICKACGSQIEDGATVCGVCGATQDDVSTYQPIDFGIAEMEEQEDGPLPDFAAPDFGFEMQGVPESDDEPVGGVPDFAAPDFGDESPDVDDMQESKVPDFEAPAFEVTPTDAASYAPGTPEAAPKRSSAPVRAVRKKVVGLHGMLSGREPGGRRRVVIGACVLLALVGAGAFAYSKLSARADAVQEVSAQEREAAERYEATQGSQTTQEEPVQRLRKYDILIPVQVEGLNGAGSRIPVQVTGAVADGTVLDEVAYISVEGNGVKLSQGTYEVRVVASPICGNGTMFHVPGDVISLVVLGDGSCTKTPDAPIVFTPMEALDMSEEQIGQSLQYISSDPERAEVAEALGNSARKKHDDAVAARDKQLQAEEQKRQAEEEKQRQAEEKQRQAEEKQRQAEEARLAEEQRKAEESAQQEQSGERAQAMAEGSLGTEQEGTTDDSSTEDSNGESQNDGNEEDTQEGTNEGDTESSSDESQGESVI